MKKVRAILRLILMLNRFFLTGLDTIFFEDKEIYNYNFDYDDFPEDKETIAFVERMKKNG